MIFFLFILYYMYQYIYCPVRNQNFYLNSSSGKNILKNYINMLLESSKGGKSEKPQQDEESNIESLNRQIISLNRQIIKIEIDIAAQEKLLDNPDNPDNPQQINLENLINQKVLLMNQKELLMNQRERLMNQTEPLMNQTEPLMQPIINKIVKKNSQITYLP